LSNRTVGIDHEIADVFGRVPVAVQIHEIDTQVQHTLHLRIVSSGQHLIQPEPSLVESACGAVGELSQVNNIRELRLVVKHLHAFLDDVGTWRKQRGDIRIEYHPQIVGK
jgi:hypothetical protein